MLGWNEFDVTGADMRLNDKTVMQQSAKWNEDAKIDPFWFYRAPTASST